MCHKRWFAKSMSHNKINYFKWDFPLRFNHGEEDLTIIIKYSLGKWE